jgi:hypothetical protein
MRHPKLNLSRFVGLFIALMPLGANAGTGQVADQIACPTLLMETECHDYQTAWRKAQSEADRFLLEDKYAALLKERSHLCPHTISLDMVDEVRARIQTKQPRFFAGRKISM